MPPRFLDDLALYLEGLGHGSLSARTISKGSIPDKPRDLIVITETGGVPSQLNQQTSSAPEVVSVQIKARNQRQELARDALLAIQNDLHRLTNADLGNFTIKNAYAIDRPAISNRNSGSGKESWELVSNYELLVVPN